MIKQIRADITCGGHRLQLHADSMEELVENIRDWGDWFMDNYLITPTPEERIKWLESRLESSGLVLSGRNVSGN